MPARRSRLDHHQLEIGGEAGRLRLLEHRDPAVRIALPGRVQQPVHARQAEMEDAPAGLRRNRNDPASAGRPRPDRRYACAGRCLREPKQSVNCVGSSRVTAICRRSMPKLSAWLEQEAAVLVIADDADGLHRHRGVELLHVDGEIGGRAAAAHVDLSDLGDRILRRPEVDHLVEIDAPGPAGDEAAPRVRHRMCLSRLSTALP